MNHPTDQFRAAMVGAGLVPPDELIPDAALHRFPTSNRRGDKSGWYVLHLDGIPAGGFGCWREGVSQTWCAKSDTAMSDTEREAHRQRLEAIRAARADDKAHHQQQAAEQAARRWEAATPAAAHPYLTQKGVQANGTRCEGEALLIPMRDAAGKLRSLQVIDPEGGKRFHTGGQVKGCYFSIGKPAGVLIVCEGYATGASIHEATGHAVAVAFSAGNLEAVAQLMRAKFPTARVIVAADDDHLTPGNPGMAKATAAALAVGGLVAVPVFPDFPEPRPDKATDFNDLHQLAGLEAVRIAIEAASPTTRASTGDDWPDPVQLPDALTPVMPFDPDLLPLALRGWVADGAHRMQCPPDFMAVGAVVALSSLIGARAVVAPKERDTWRVVPNLWGLIVGRPGVMKSPALSEAMQPLNRLESNERAQWQAAHEAWAVDSKMSDMANEAREKQARVLVTKDPAAARELLTPTDRPSEPTMRRFVVNDATVEKLGEILTVNPWGLLVFRDELHGLLCSMDKQGQEGARGFYLTGYDGNQGHAVDRIGRGESYISRVCIAMLGGTQPGKVQRYVRDAVAGGAGDDGLLQRFGLAVWPDVDREFKYVNQWPDTPAKQTAWTVFERLAALQPDTDTDPQEWRFSCEAQALFVEWLVPFETEIRGDDLHPALVSHLAKYRKLVPALALIFALVDTPDSGGEIHVQELIRALAWSEYLRSHAERLYAAAVIPETGGAEALLSKIKAGKLRDGDGVLLETFEPWKVAVKHWAGLGTPDAVRKAAELLEGHGWLKRDDVASGVKGGRPSERYRIHPALFGRGTS